MSWVVLRGYETLPHSVSNDLDLAVLSSDAESFFSFIVKVCKENSLSIEIILLRFGCVKFVIKSQDVELIKLDVWFDINFWGLEYLKLDNAFDNLIFDNRGFYRLSENDEFVVSFFKEILHNNLIRADKIQHLRNLFSQNKHHIYNSSLVQFYLSQGAKKYILARYLFLFDVFFRSFSFSNTFKLLKRFYYFLRFRFVSKNFKQLEFNVAALRSVKP